MTPKQTKAWLEECMESEELFEHERAIFKVMIGALPIEDELHLPKYDALKADQTRLDIEENLQEQIKPIITSGGKELKGTERAWFLEFWNAFNHKKVSSRAAAAQSWFKMKDKKTQALVDHITAAARHEARNRGDIAKHAQGWLTERRWEQFDMESVLPTEWNEEKWLKSLTPYLKRTRTWPEYMPGHNPWEHKNEQIPASIRKTHRKLWGWVK